MLKSRHFWLLLVCAWCITSIAPAIPLYKVDTLVGFAPLFAAYLDGIAGLVALLWWAVAHIVVSIALAAGTWHSFKRQRVQQ